MSLESKKLLEDRAVIAGQMNDLTAKVQTEDRSFNPDELQQFDRMMDEFKSLTDKIETVKRCERTAELTAKREDYTTTAHKPLGNVTRQDKELAFKAWALSASGKGQYIRREHAEAAHKLGVNLNTDTISISLPNDNRTEVEKMVSRGADVQRNQSSQLGSEGGYLQNDGIFMGLERNLKWFGGARRVARVIRTETGEPISWSYSDDTSNVAGQSAQNVTVSNTSVVYQKKTLGEYTYNSGVYPVSVQLLQDARVDVSADIGEVLGQRLGRQTNSDYTNGTGASQPTGFMTDALLGATTASNSAIAYTDLVAALFSIDPAYRDDPSFAFTMSDSTLSYLWKLEDQNGRPLFWNQMMNLASGMELRILDKPVVVNNAMASIAASAKVIACGAFNKFIIRDVHEAQVIALRERYMDQLAVGFIAYLRTDSKLINPNCVKVLQMHS
jgi:HK97 family phage major capsid protein